MRKWMIGLLAMGSVIAFAPGAMAQSEYGRDAEEGWFGYYDDYPAYGYAPGPMVVMPAPGVAAATPPMAYFSPPAANPQPAPQAQVRGPGQCGTYLYWSDGQCVDARTRSK